MPLEIKKIYFTECELRKALINYSILHKKFLDVNDVKKMVINKDDTVKVSFLVDQALEFDEDKINYTHSEVAAALLAFCMACEIPVPRAGTKELHATEEQIVLKIRYEKEAKFEKYKICSDLQKVNFG